MSTETYNGFCFRYVHDVQSPGAVRIYVEDQPSYGDRDSSVHRTHLVPAAGGVPPYIDLKPSLKPTSFADAQRIARQWADCTDAYIRTGVPVEEWTNGETSDGVQVSPVSSEFTRCQSPAHARTV